MYIGAFFVGLILIGLSIFFATRSDTPDQFLTAFFGASGAIDIGYLLYKPAREIQNTRANASQLFAAFWEYKFISIWSGKTYDLLYKSLEKKGAPQKEIFGQMVQLLTLKKDLTIQLIEAIEKNVEKTYTKDEQSDSSEKEISEKTEEKISEEKIKLDKSNQARATKQLEDKIDYSGWNLIKQKENFVLGEDKDLGKCPSEQNWTSTSTETEFEKEPTSEEKEGVKTQKPDKPDHKCSGGCVWTEKKEWNQWSLFKHESKDRWKLRCYHNVQWECIKKPPQVDTED